MDKIDEEIKNECVEIMHSNLSDELKIKLIAMVNNQTNVNPNVVVNQPYSITYPAYPAYPFDSVMYGDTIHTIYPDYKVTIESNEWRS